MSNEHRMLFGYYTERQTTEGTCCGLGSADDWRSKMVFEGFLNTEFASNELLYS